MNRLDKIRREYDHPPLLEESMNEDPYVQFKVWFDDAFQVYELDANAMFLSTVNASGQPSSRTVLLKGVSEEGFMFYTNYESKKGMEILSHPQVALLFFWPGLDRQIRIEGIAQKVSSEASDEYFYSRPRGSQISAIVSPQSREVSGYNELESAWEKMQSEEELSRPDQWGGFVVKPEYFEFWQGRKNRLHDRLIYQKNVDRGGFHLKRLAP
ncbi:pyridoxamine 5'-phosphate oxidase [Membranihabitans marinus]|uniref:pyridoxamine 5'-phosphate oxidase n=1 Tax=Membranihabitans marinus TaxID=1227546 RepID=UPI001F026A8F|nr:pyridoxamine 5'-phosphate oxidase [Membranihabitans marinus]